MVANRVVTEIRDASFLALSFDPAVANSYRTDFEAPLRRRAKVSRPLSVELEVPSGTPVGYVDEIARWPSPIHEVLLARGAAVTIEAVSVQNQVLHVRGRVRGFVTPPSIEDVLAQADLEFEDERKRTQQALS